MTTYMNRLPLLSILFVLATNAGLAQFRIEVAFPNLTFKWPVDLQHPPDGSNRLFVIEQEGRIYGFDNDPNVAAKQVFLDMGERIVYGGERGLLGLAFHPNYADSGYFYVNYTASGPPRTVVSRFTVSGDDPDSADVSSEFVILEIEQPYANHNGGQLVFGPDGYLYIGMGDGGNGGDPEGHGQNRHTLLGALLRIDVDHPMEGIPYGIPADNPFVGNQDGVREEIYAYGLRNPWRFSFDSVTGELWLADVGQNAYEEIDMVTSGGNYGWNIMEGWHCYLPASNCDTTGLSRPIWEYDHSKGFSITGGFVYHGAKIAELQGKYIYADWGSGTGWMLDYDGGGPPMNTELFQMGARSVSSFGVDEAGELYICSFDGRIYTLTDPVIGTEGQSIPAGFALHQNTPNPFNPVSMIRYEIPRATEVTLSIHDILGQEITKLVDDYREPGYHQVQWAGKDHSGRNVPSGIYIARLVTPEYTKSIKMVLLR